MVVHGGVWCANEQDAMVVCGAGVACGGLCYRCVSWCGTGVLPCHGDKTLTLLLAV